MVSCFFKFFLLFGLLPAFVQASPQQDILNSHQKSVALTIYPHDLGLVQDVREVPVFEGDTRLIIYDIASKFLEESLLIRSLDKTPLLLKEQSFYFTPLTVENLLEKSMGQPINVTEKEGHGKEKNILPGKLLAVSGATALVDFGERIESVPVKDVAFLKIPPSLSLHPAINALVQSAQAKSTPLEITYLTKGLAWEARYTVDIHASKNKLDISGWITLKNTSGLDFRKAKIQLATPVNLVENAATSAASPYAAPQTYPLPFPVTLHDGADKTVSFLAAKNIPISKSYRIYLPHRVHTNREGALVPLPVQTWLSFTNTPENGLGKPLPAGKIKIYARDQEESPLYRGEAKTDPVALQKPISLRLGVSTKIKAETQQTDFRRLGDKVLESAYRVDLTNPTDQPVPVLMIQKVAGSWALLRESHPSVAKGNEISWSLKIPARQTLSVRYRVRLTDWKE